MKQKKVCKSLTTLKTGKETFRKVYFQGDLNKDKDKAFLNGKETKPPRLFLFFCNSLILVIPRNLTTTKKKKGDN